MCNPSSLRLYIDTCVIVIAMCQRAKQKDEDDRTEQYATTENFFEKKNSSKHFIMLRISEL